MNKKRSIIWVVSLTIAVFIIWNVVITFYVKDKEGIVSNIAEVPYIGEYLRDFETTGNIKYVCSLNNFRGSAGIITGISSPEAFEKFISKDKNWHNGGSDDMADFWASRCQDFGKSFDEFPIGNSVEDPYLTNSFKKDGRAIQIELAYRLSDNRFSIYFMNLFDEK